MELIISNIMWTFVLIAGLMAVIAKVIDRYDLPYRVARVLGDVFFFSVFSVTVCAITLIWI